MMTQQHHASALFLRHACQGGVALFAGTGFQAVAGCQRDGHPRTAPCKVRGCCKSPECFVLCLPRLGSQRIPQTPAELLSSSFKPVRSLLQAMMHMQCHHAPRQSGRIPLPCLHRHAPHRQQQGRRIRPAAECHGQHLGLLWQCLPPAAHRVIHHGRRRLQPMQLTGRRRQPGARRRHDPTPRRKPAPYSLSARVSLKRP